MAQRKTNQRGRTTRKTGMKRELASGRTRESVDRASDIGGRSSSQRTSSSTRSRTSQSAGRGQKRSAKNPPRGR